VDANILADLEETESYIKFECTVYGADDMIAIKFSGTVFEANAWKFKIQ
jgi:hypothetical protein